MTPKGAAEVEILVQGLPLASATHGGLGWSTIGLVRTGDRIVLVDSGGPGIRMILRERLAERGIAPADVTDVLITHAHWDHLHNITVFPDATIHLSARELAWARTVEPGETHVSEAHAALLAAPGARVHLLEPGDEPVSGILAVDTAGHTPGHLAYLVQEVSRRSVFVGDAVKNRQEFREGRFAATDDASSSHASWQRIRDLAAHGPLRVIFGHDGPIELVDGDTRDLPSVPGSIELILTGTGEVLSLSLAPDAISGADPGSPAGRERGRRQ